MLLSGDRVECTQPICQKGVKIYNIDRQKTQTSDK